VATSSIPAVKQALVDLLAARANLRNVQVTYGAPLPAPAKEYIWVGDVTGEQTAGALGGQVRDEEYTVQVNMSVVREGNNQRAADTRCFQLLAELEDLLRSNPSLGVAAVLKGGEAELGEFNLEEFVSDTARESRLTAQVAVNARI